MINNTNNLYNLLYNGPHEAISTSQKGFSITVSNIFTSVEIKDKLDHGKVDILIKDVPKTIFTDNKIKH